MTRRATAIIRNYTVKYEFTFIGIELLTTHHRILYIIYYILYFEETGYGLFETTVRNIITIIV